MPVTATSGSTVSPLEGLVSATVGAVVSTSKLDVTCGAALPAASCASAWSVCAPSPSVAAVTDQSPLTSAVTVSVCSLAVPASMTTVTVAPGSVVPVMSGVVSLVALPSTGVSTASVGAVRSTLKSRVMAGVVLPSVSCAVTEAV